MRHPYLIHHSVVSSAKLYPHKCAFKCGNYSLTYSELDLRSSQIAKNLIENGLKKGDRVGVLMNRCLETSFSIYGIMRAGGIYVPLDHKAPKKRLSFLIKDCDIFTIITTSKQMGLVGQLQLESLRVIMADQLEWESECRFESPFTILEDDPAYILYTSGSTGVPKGIVHTHRSGLAYAKLVMDTFSVSEMDVIANHAPIFFDISTFAYFAGPLAGAKVVILEDGHTIMIASLVKLIQNEKITIWYSVPRALVQLKDTGLLNKQDHSSLRWVLYAGERFPIKDLREIMAILPSATYCNIYGPTETNQCTHYIIDNLEDLEEVPIGMVWGNTEYLVKNEDSHYYDEIAIRTLIPYR